MWYESARDGTLTSAGSYEVLAPAARPHPPSHREASTRASLGLGGRVTETVAGAKSLGSVYSQRNAAGERFFESSFVELTPNCETAYFSQRV